MQPHQTQPTRAQKGGPRLPALARQPAAQQSRRAAAKAAALAARAKPFVATARRVPWRRLQINDVDGPIQVWSEPGYKGV